ncbi:MAG TPA: C45 family peptidase, partial [Polyangiaceae bacterium]|nr:C45 family peptidase [Polyangiaceae bacterium]
PKLRRLGTSFVVERERLLEVHLGGPPESIGSAHARLLYPEMVENEGVLLDRFRTAIPSGFLQALVLDLAQLRYRELSLGLPLARQRELAAGALAFEPDPYATFFPAYQRFVYLNALYDIALSFEQSPLIGCTTFVFSGEEAVHGGSLLARAFDFEIDILDEKKAAFFVRETGRIPFASVAWPGLVGVVSGMNAEGVAVVVHGGRAGETRTRGVPVVHALRDVLGRARTSREALAVLADNPPLVSHIVVITDARGHALVVERVPESADHVRELGPAGAVTNHLEGPAARDPKNLRVREKTSTLARRARADELVHEVARPVDAKAAIGLLRDRRAEGGRELPLGDRRAIDALIATHGVVMDTAARVLWVSEAPHLLGRFVAFDLRRFLDPAYSPNPDEALPTLPPDPLLTELDTKLRNATSAQSK